MTDRLARIALPLACALSWLVIAGLQRDPTVAAEARYLGLLTGVVLIAALTAAPRIGTLLGTTVVLLGTIAWALPGTADRGAATTLLLAATLAIAATSREAGVGFSLARADDDAQAVWPARRVTGIAIGAQLLARSGDLLALSTSDVLSVVGWAAVATLAVIAIGRHHGLFAAGIAGAVAFVVGPGFTAVTALALVAPVLATLSSDRSLALWIRIVSAAALLASVAWDFERGAFIAFAAIAIAGPIRFRWIAGLAFLAAFFLTDVDGVAIVVPAVLLAAVSEVGRHPLALTLQRTWVGVLAFVVAVLAAYPWLRADAVRDAGTLFGLGEGPRAALATIVLLVVAAALSAALARFGSRSGETRHAQARPSTASAIAPLAIAALLAALVLFTHPRAVASPIEREPVVLDAGAPSWSRALAAPARAATVVVDSSLSHAAGLAAGTPIAEIRLTTERGIVALPLRAGIDSGEWAARRPDVAALPGFTAPAPWLHWVDSGREFFGQRYRARLALEEKAAIEAIEVRLSPGLSSDVAVTLFHLDLTR